MKRITIIAILVLLTTAVAQGQIKIGGNVYGGGNAGDMTGNTSVTVFAGDVKDVYGGARMADVGGRTFVNIDGEHVYVCGLHHDGVTITVAACCRGI